MDFEMPNTYGEKIPVIADISFDNKRVKVRWMDKGVVYAMLIGNADYHRLVRNGLTCTESVKEVIITEREDDE